MPGVIGLVLGNVLGCAEQGPGQPRSRAPEVGLEDAVPEAVGAGHIDVPERRDVPPPSLFDVTRVHTVNITLAPGYREALVTEPTVPVPAVVTVDGVRREAAEVRLKGSNSFRTLDDKPAWRLHFMDAPVAGVRRLVLNNMVSDSAQGREVLAWWAWRRAGLVGPRATFAQVSLDGENLGLYAMLEALDDTWMARQGDDGSGSLWEGNDGADLTPAGLSALEDGTNRSDRDRLEQAAVALADDSAPFLDVAAPWVDTDAMLGFLAWTSLLGNLDGYPYSLDDVWFVGSSVAGGRYAPVPWGLDETWNPAWRWQWGLGRLSAGCHREPHCRDALLGRLTEELDRYEALDLPRVGAELFAVTDAVVEKDPRRTWSVAEVTEAREGFLDLVDEWPRRVRTSAWPPP